MGKTAKQKCPDCSGVMADIEIIDKTVPSWPRPQVSIQTALEYVVPTRERKFLLDTLPIEGKIAARMCVSCGRIALYGQPKAVGKR